MKDKKVLAFTALIILMIPLLSGCSEDELPEALVCERKVMYASNMLFTFRMVEDGVAFVDTGFSVNVIARIWPEATYWFSPSFTELVLVHSEAEASGFPDSVIVAWPSEKMLFYIAVLNFWVSMDECGLAEHSRDRGVITLEDFGLSYPLTVADFVDSWEQVIALLDSLTSSERHSFGRDSGVSLYQRFIEHRHNERLPEALICEQKTRYAANMQFVFRMVDDGVTYIETGFPAMTLSRIWSGSIIGLFNPYFTELVLVRSEAEAERFPDSTVTAWQSERTLRALARLNEAVAMTESELQARYDCLSAGTYDGTRISPIDLYELNIQYIMSVEEMVERWESEKEIEVRMTPIDLSNFGLYYPITSMDLIENWESVSEVWSLLDMREQSNIRRTP